MPPLLRLSAGCAARTGQPRGGADRRLRASRAPWPRRRFRIPPGERVYTCFTSDFLVEEADGWRAEAWEMMRLRRDLEFFFITKRIGRLREQLPPDWGDGYENVTVGCTVENQAAADLRLPLFLETPLRHRVIVCAPLLERDRPHALARARGRGGLRRRRVGQRRTAVRLRMGPRAPRAVRGRRSSLHLPPDRRPVRQGGTPLPHPPGAPARPGPQGGYRLPPGTIAPKRCPEPECGRNGNRTEGTARKKPPPGSARQQKNPALRPKKRKSRKLNGYGNRYQSFDEASGAACE